MGIYLNPGNDGFKQTRNKKYVDKSDLIHLVNDVLFTNEKLLCVSRPRRFGKTLAAQMLCAYYDKSCDSYDLFKDLKIARRPGFKEHLNKYNVIYIDLTWFVSKTDKIENIVSDINDSILVELKEAFGDCIPERVTFLPEAMVMISQATGERFFVIIDEWDALIREAKEKQELQKEYIQFLRGLFKGPATPRTIVGAYMTGILPIKKYGTESALTDFREYTMVEPFRFAPYIGFTEEEVKNLCENTQMDFELMKQWYDGYSFDNNLHMYSPNSVMSAVSNGKTANYWTQSETYESLKQYIIMNLDGLKDAIIAMLGGQRIIIDPLSFQNDLSGLSGRDDVLTLLVHLGYFSYDRRTNKVSIPNLEVADSFKQAVNKTGWDKVSKALQQSSQLLEETLAGNADYVAEALEQIHESSSSVLQYNNENSLACALKIAYYAAQNDYIIVREFPTGKGFADLAFLPRKYSDKPAMIVELKYDKDADSAIRQIKEKRYGGELKDYAGELVLVGINYDKESKKHSCGIEMV